MVTLDEWEAKVDIVLDRLRDFFLPPDFQFDFSRESLSDLEAVLLDGFRPGRSVPPAGEDFIESAIAYVGESALRQVGGGWAVGPHPLDQDRDVPYVEPDPALGLLPVYPLMLLGEAGRERSGQVLAGFHDRLAAVVADHPDFVPPVYPQPAPPTGSAELDRWLAERERTFPGWLADYADGDEAFDFSPESLEPLQEMLRQRMPDGVDEAVRVERADLIQGAAWYFGEVVARNKKAGWVSPPPDDPVPNEYFLYDAERDATTYPFSAVELTCQPGEPVSMRHMYDMFL